MFDPSFPGQDEMHLSEQLIEQLVDQSANGVQILDGNGLTVQVNEAFLRLYGYDDRESVEGRLNPYTDKESDGDGLSAYLARAYRGEVVHVPPARYQRSRNADRMIRVTMTPVDGPDGSIEGVIVMHEDVTELMATESALERRYEQIAALQRTFSEISESPDQDTMLGIVLAAMRRLCQSDACAIWIRDDEGSWRCMAAEGLSERYQKEITAAYRTDMPVWLAPFNMVSGKRTSIIEDTEVDPLDESLREIVLREGIRRILAVPMRRNDQVDGALVFYGRQPGTYDPVDADVAKLLADQVAVAIHNADLLQEAKSTAEEARILYETSSVLAQALLLPDLARALSDTVAPLMGHVRITVNLLDPYSGELQPIAATGAQVPELERAGVGSLSGLSEVRRVLETGKPLVLEDLDVDALVGVPEGRRAALKALDIRSIIAVPLRDGESIGVMSFDSPGVARRWSDRDVRLALGVAQQTAAALRTARLIEETRASRDELEERVRSRTDDLKAAHDEVIASERLAAIGIMAREVAHGLRNPLNVISTSLYYLKSRFPQPDEKIERHFDTIARSVDQSANMINHLTNVAGPRRAQPSPLDLNHLVQRLLQDRFVAEDIRWEAQYDPELPYVSGDWIQLNHAIKALLGNVFGADTTGILKITTGRDGDMACLAVGGCRAKLSDEERAALFEPFSVTSTQWTGLGLSVARQIAVKHGGDVTMDERDGLTWFRMTLPFAEEGPSS